MQKPSNIFHTYDIVPLFRHQKIKSVRLTLIAGVFGKRKERKQEKKKKGECNARRLLTNFHAWSTTDITPTLEVSAVGPVHVPDPSELDVIVPVQRVGYGVVGHQRRVHAAWNLPRYRQACNIGQTVTTGVLRCQGLDHFNLLRFLLSETFYGLWTFVISKTNGEIMWYQVKT